MRKDCTNDPAVIKDILDQADILWLALSDEHGPHSVPVNFAYVDGIVYVHSNHKGRKAACLKSGAPLAFSAAVDVTRKRGENACQFGFRFRSVMGRGTPLELTGEAHRRGLDAITLKYAGALLPYNEAVMPKTAVFAITPADTTARNKE